MPRHAASGAPQMPQPSTPRNVNSKPMMMSDIATLSSILPWMNPQMRRKLSVANTMVVMGEKIA